MKIKVDGQEYEFPAIDSLTMDETILLERVAGHNIAELVPGDSMPMGAVKAFVMIAVMRANPNVSEREIAESIGKIKLADMDDLMEGDDAGPPDGEAEGTPLNSAGSTQTSGEGSSERSDLSPDVNGLNGSGTSGSPTTAISARETSAA